jgi:antitoxin (DNA-binding transcriptional repressor) of toxin-antitoxin stability system
MIDMLDYGHDTIVMKIDHVSKSRFKAHALELFRQVEQSGQPIIITDRGIPVLTLTPYQGDPDAVLTALRGSVLEYTNPTGSVGEGDWELLPP